MYLRVAGDKDDIEKKTFNWATKYWENFMSHTVCMIDLERIGSLYCFQISLAVISKLNKKFFPYIHLSIALQLSYGSGHETVAVLLPGFAINW